MSAERPRDELAELLTRFLEGDISLEEHARLAEILASDSQARARYLKVIEVHALLHWREWKRPEIAFLPPIARASQQTVALDASSSTSILKMSYWREHRAKFAALALALTLLFWVGFYFAVLRDGADDVRPEIVPRDFIARVSGASNVVWPQEGAILAEGDQLEQGQRIELAAGVLEITFGKEAQVLLQGPAVLVIDSSGACTLEEGKLVATAESESSHGFLVDTTLAEIIDLGTKFGVSSSEAGGTIVEVFEGSVDATPYKLGPGNRRQSRMLTAGQVATLSAESETFVLQAGEDAPSPRFVQTLPEPLPGIAPIRVSSSVVSEGNHPPERLVDGSGLRGGGELGSRRHVAATFHPNHTEDQSNYWLGQWGEEPVVLTFDLGSEYKLSSLWVWNFYLGGIIDARQVARIRYALSNDGENFVVAGESALVSGDELAARSSPRSVEGQSIPLAGEARYVRIEVLDISQPDHTREVALGEVRFEGTPIQPEQDNRDP